MIKTHLIKILIFALIIFTNITYAQMNLHDNYVGISVSAELDNNVLSFNGNFEHELFKIGSSLIGVGTSIKHTSWSSDVSSIFFVAGQINCNFANIGDGKFVPLVGIMFGSNLDFLEPYYSGHVGIRYFVDKDISIVIKTGFGRRSYIFPEVGVDYRF